MKPVEILLDVKDEPDWGIALRKMLKKIEAQVEELLEVVSIMTECRRELRDDDSVDLDGSDEDS